MIKYANGKVVLLQLIGCVLTTCPVGCTYCDPTLNICSHCDSTEILASGSCRSCPKTCERCNGYTCTSCISGWWGYNCQVECPANCQNGCHSDNGYCNYCKVGFYGQNCEHNCNLCRNETCDLRACINGCKPGYFEYGDNNVCLPCPPNCRSCDNTLWCNICNDGYYILVTGYWSNQRAYCYSCSIDKCKNCSFQKGSVVCTECVEGYKYDGKKCIVADNVCAEGCFGACDTTGLCVTCIDGWTGERCSEPCARQCLSCSKINRNICQQCKDDNYTAACNAKCPPSCARVENKQTCRIDDGYCLNNCVGKLWGQFCNLLCAAGCMDNGDQSQICNRKDGKCENGCKIGYTGDNCDTVVVVEPTTTVKATEEDFNSLITTVSASKAQASSTRSLANEKVGTIAQKDDSIVIIGLGAGGGVVLLLFVSVLIVCFVKRRYKPITEKDDEERETTNVTEISNTNANTCAHSREPDCETEPETQDYIYAKPNKVHKSKTHCEKEDEGRYRMYDNVNVDINIEQMTVDETDVDNIKFEDLQEGDSSFTDPEVNIPTTNVYYNTESLIRSRIQVSNLLEYIKSKSDFITEFEKLPEGLTRTCNEALKPGNRLKNRYNGIYAYDATRVVLQSKRYVNASYVDGHDKSPAYIASLGPTKSTMDNFETFLEMAWQENTDKIIMLTNLEEGEKMKCEQYWPEQGTYKIYGDYKVACTAEKIFSELTVRDLLVTRGSGSLKVTQFHYTAWPDKAAPDNVASLLEFRDKVEQRQTRRTGPMMVHCSAGIGRTGTYIALDILIKEGRQEDSVDIFGCVNALRGQRVHMVQNVEQYVYLHHCVLYALTCDTEPLPTTAVPHYMTDERISVQHQAFVSMQLLANGEKTKMKSRKENRKGADIPSEDHRVRVALRKHDYINAVYLNGYQRVNKLIAAQTPLPNTLEDFVSMLYQERCPCVVCLDEENVMDKSVAQYLPPANKVSTFGHYQVECMNSDQSQDYVIRELKISRIGSPLCEVLSVFHYQFRGWASTDCDPPRILAFLKMVIDVDKTMQRLSCEQPLLVHCATGAERSGLYCAVSILLEKVAVEKDLSVLNTICQICSRRTSAFRDIEHLRFCYNCVEEMLEMSDTYYNTKNV